MQQECIRNDATSGKVCPQAAAPEMDKRRASGRRGRAEDFQERR